MKLKIMGLKDLAGCKIGFYVPSKGKIYACPSVARLASTDLSLLSSLRVFRMPKDASGKNKFETLEDWVLDVQERHIIFGEVDEPKQ